MGLKGLVSDLCSYLQCMRRVTYAEIFIAAAMRLNLADLSHLRVYASSAHTEDEKEEAYSRKRKRQLQNRSEPIAYTEGSTKLPGLIEAKRGRYSVFKHL